MKEQIKKVIKEFHELELPEIVERDLIDIDFNTKKIITLFGHRRSGKTFYFYQIIKYLMNRGVEKNSIVYINFEDERILPFKINDFETFLESYYELYPENKNNEIFIFFDEIQNINNWETAIRRIYDKEKCKIFLTGSSSKLMSKEIAAALRGRTLSYEMLPFSFKEFLRANKININEHTVYSNKRFIVKKMMEKYIKFGGFPEVVLTENETTKIRILQEYFNTVLFRDLIERFSIKNTNLMKEMIKFMTSNISQYFSLSGFYKFAKKRHKVTKRTVLDYASYLEDVEFVFFINKYSTSIKDQIRNLKKLYIIDIGFRTASGFYSSEDYGRVIENLVFLKLKEMKINNPLIDVFYWSDYKSEVDFLIKEGINVKELIQVCYDLSREETKKREIDALIKAMNEFGLKRGLIVTYDFEGEEEIDKKKIIYMPLWKFLLK